MARAAHPDSIVGKVILAAAAMLRQRARYLRTPEGRRAAEWHVNDADMVAGELERQASALTRMSGDSLLNVLELDRAGLN